MFQYVSSNSFFSTLRLFGTENVHPSVYKSSDNTSSSFDFHNYRANYYVPLLGQLVTSGVVVERIPVLWAVEVFVLSFLRIVCRASSLHDDFVTKRKLRLDYWATVVELPSGNTQTFLL